jgi:hypothetical protein
VIIKTSPKSFLYKLHLKNAVVKMICKQMIYKQIMCIKWARIVHNYKIIIIKTI